MRKAMLGAILAAALILAPAAGNTQTPGQQTPGGAGKAPPGGAGQTPGAAGPAQPGAPPATPGAPGMPSPGTPEAGAQATNAPLTIDLSGALDRARAYNQQFLAAGFAASLAREERIQAKAALFPTLNAFNQYIYTQGNGTPSGVFVANDGVHIYNEQAVVHGELFSVTKLADYRRALAGEAAAQAKREIAVRGLVATVVQSYYGLITAQRHAANAKLSVDEAQRFLDITEKQQRGGEVARADVIKAQLQLQQRQRELLDAQLNMEKAQIALGIMLFPDINRQYRIIDDLTSENPLPTLDETRTMAFRNNPDIRAAEAGLRQAHYGVKSARGAYYPTLVVDYFYGIDANVFATRGPDDRKNLGSVVQGTVTIPVWTWGATRSKVRQAEIQQQQAQTDLNLTRRQLESEITSFFLEAQAARQQLASLRSSADLSAESLRLTVLRYQAGEATALEVADAQTTLVQARNAYDDGLARYRLAIANLQTLTGKF